MRGAALVTILACACSAKEPEAPGQVGSSGATAADASASLDATAEGDSSASGGNQASSSIGASTLATSDGGSSSSTGEPIDPAWQEFLDRRTDDLLALKVPIATCVANF